MTIEWGEQNAIKSVTRVPDACACGAARVRIVFQNGAEIVKHDDGSLMEYVGDSDYQPAQLP